MHNLEQSNFQSARKTSSNSLNKFHGQIGKISKQSRYISNTELRSASKTKVNQTEDSPRQFYTKFLTSPKKIPNSNLIWTNGKYYNWEPASTNITQIPLRTTTRKRSSNIKGRKSISSKQLKTQLTHIKEKEKRRESEFKIIKNLVNEVHSLKAELTGTETSVRRISKNHMKPGSPNLKPFKSTGRRTSILDSIIWQNQLKERIHK